MMRAMAEPTPIGANKHKRERVHSFIRPTIEMDQTHDTVDHIQRCGLHDGLF